MSTVERTTRWLLYDGDPTHDVVYEDITAVRKAAERCEAKIVTRVDYHDGRAKKITTVPVGEMIGRHLHHRTHLAELETCA